jgi:hypothetical protein
LSRLVPVTSMVLAPASGPEEGDNLSSTVNVALVVTSEVELGGSKVVPEVPEVPV